MERNSFLWFLILSGSFLQAFASLSEEDSNASSNFLVRKKRIINDDENEIEHQEIRYVVLLTSERGHCTGTILTPHVVLTAAHCVTRDHVVVISGVPKTGTQRRHTVVNVIVHDEFRNDVLFVNDLALVVIREPIDIREHYGYNRGIRIYNETLPENAHGLVSGWGNIAKHSLEIPTRVRSILVPIMDHHTCSQLTGEKIQVNEKHICTLYTNKEKCCWNGDSGGPLVYNNHIVGVFSAFHKHPEMPDVYMNLLYPPYKSWVETWVTHIHTNNLYHH